MQVSGRAFLSLLCFALGLWSGHEPTVARSYLERYSSKWERLTGAVGRQLFCFRGITY